MNSKDRSPLLTAGLAVAAYSLLAMLMPLNSVFAQADPANAPAPNPPAEAAKNDQPIKLSTFVVNTDKDTGYIASDSLVGGQISTKLLMTPSDISVLTRAFLDDIAADNYLDASVWLTGATVNTQYATGVPNDNGNDVSFRGLSGSSPSLNYFRYNNNVDAFMIEREESARGPNSLLFGDGVVGGMLNFITKQPALGHEITAVQFRLDNWGSKRATVDVNRAIGDKVAIRVNLLGNEGRSWVPTYYDDRFGAQLSAIYKPFKNTEVRVEAEGDNWRKDYAPAFFVDNNSSWNHVYTIPGPLTASTPAGTGTVRFTTDRLVYTSGNPTAGVMNYLNFGTTQGSSLSIPSTPRPIGISFPEVPRNFSVQPPNTLTAVSSNMASATINQRVGDSIIAQLAFQHSQEDTVYNQQVLNGDQIDVNAVLPNGAPNPNFLQSYSEVDPSVGLKNYYTNDVRFAAAYQLPFKSFTQRINIMADSRQYDMTYVGGRWARSNGTDPNIQSTANILLIRYYYYQQPPPAFFIPTNSNGYQFGFAETTNSLDKYTMNNVQIATVGSYWDDRISLVAGLNRLFYSDNQQAIATFGANGQAATYSKLPTHLQETQPTVGTVIFPIPQIGGYANYSETFNPSANNGFPRMNGVFPEPVIGRGFSEGLRFNLLDGKLVGSAGHYSIHQVNNRLTYPTSVINGIWTSLNESQNDFSLTSYTDTLTQDAKGYEFELVGSPTRHIRLSVNLALPQTTQSDALPDTKAYYAAHIAEWQAFANSTNALANTVQQDINQIVTNIQNANEGRALNGTSKYIANFFGMYSFDSGVLKGFRIGGGVNVSGKTIIGNVFNLPYNYIYRNPYALATAVTGYQFKLKQVDVNVQLNVSNAFNYSRPIFTTTTTYLSVSVPNNFFYNPPRTTALTVTFGY